MSFPQIQNKSKNYTITPQIALLIDQKFQPLGKFTGNAEDAKCEIELERIGDHQSGRIFRAEVNLYMMGKMFRAEAIEEQMESAIDSIQNELKRELQRAHGKRQSLMRRGGQALKHMLRFGR